MIVITQKLALLGALLFTLTYLDISTRIAKIQGHKGRDDLDHASARSRRGRGLVSLFREQLTNLFRTDDNYSNPPKKLSGEPRIVGGVPAGVNSYPSFAFNAATSSLCGGTLIHPDIVLTAAHCAGVWMGGVFIGGTTIDGSASTFIGVDSEFPHPDYNDPPGSEHNDIMLVKLSEPSSAPVQDLNFDPNFPPAGTTVTAIGFGATSEGGLSSEILLEVQSTVLSFAECNDYYGTIDNAIQICMGTDGGGKDTCQGDSGGPMYVNTGGTNIEVGLVSFGDGCARAGVPSVFARISGYEDWIKAGICDLSSDPPATCRAATISPAPNPIMPTSVPAAPTGTTQAPSTTVPTPGLVLPTIAPVGSTSAPDSDAPTLNPAFPQNTPAPTPSSSTLVPIIASKSPTSLTPVPSINAPVFVTNVPLVPTSSSTVVPTSLTPVPSKNAPVMVTNVPLVPTSSSTVVPTKSPTSLTPVPSKNAPVMLTNVPLIPAPVSVPATMMPQMAMSFTRVPVPPAMEMRSKASKTMSQSKTSFKSGKGMIILGRLMKGKGFRNDRYDQNQLKPQGMKDGKGNKSSKSTVAPTISTQPSMFPSNRPSNAPTSSAVPSSSPSDSPSSFPTFSFMPTYRSSKSAKRMNIFFNRMNKGKGFRGDRYDQNQVKPRGMKNTKSNKSGKSSKSPAPTISAAPSISPQPSRFPSDEPSLSPTTSFMPTKTPSDQPSTSPTESPSDQPSNSPSVSFMPTTRSNKSAKGKGKGTNIYARSMQKGKGPTGGNRNDRNDANQQKPQGSRGGPLKRRPHVELQQRYKDQKAQENGS